MTTAALDSTKTLGDDGEIGKQNGSTEAITKKEMHPYLMAVALMMTVLPGVVFVVMAANDGNACSKQLEDCSSLCEASYENAILRFQSQAKAKLECLDNCEQKHGVLCVKKSVAGFVYAMLLMSGIVFVFVLNIIFPSCQADSNDPTEDFSDKARSAYIEPAYAEEDLRKHEQNKMRYFWQDRHKPPNLVEIQCNNCGFICQLDEKWWKVKKGGMKPALCKRCRSVLAGVI
eukprot:TRINITY_DN10066_c0_g1_i1.p1 TRINITY_DN10066_c0_g1~~TRINITY_DN10066_c0_g1_i1.p1  ORF type:complete len:231 (-),score=52.75 TRINITY_DN10066_c0_g1_i1:24-716(-)